MGEFCKDPEGKYKMTHAITCNVSPYDDNYIQVGAQYADDEFQYEIVEVPAGILVAYRG